MVSHEPHPNIAPDEHTLEVYDEFTKDHDPVASDEYVEEKSRLINQGVPTWMRHYLDDTTGRTYFFYVGGKVVGCLIVANDKSVTSYMNSPKTGEIPELLLDLQAGNYWTTLVLHKELVEQIALLEAETEGEPNQN